MAPKVAQLRYATQQKLDLLSERLVELLKQESDPQAAMKRASRRLIEAGLSQHSPEPNESPFGFAETVIAQNPEMWDEVASMSLPNLAAIETSDELISSLLPSNYDHG